MSEMMSMGEAQADALKVKLTAEKYAALRQFAEGEANISLKPEAQDYQMSNDAFERAAGEPQMGKMVDDESTRRAEALSKLLEGLDNEELRVSFYESIQGNATELSATFSDEMTALLQKEFQKIPEMIAEAAKSGEGYAAVDSHAMEIIRDADAIVDKICEELLKRLISAGEEKSDDAKSPAYHALAVNEVIGTMQGMKTMVASKVRTAYVGIMEIVG